MFGTTLHMANRDAAFVRGREAKAAATRAERPRLEQLVTATGMDALESQLPGARRWGKAMCRCCRNSGAGARRE